MLGRKMRSNQARSIWLGIVTFGALTFSAVGQNQASQPGRGVAVPEDWSHHHVIFSHPATAEQESALAKEPRCLQQKYRRELPMMAPRAQAVVKRARVRKDR